ncbi:MAG: MFS transporter [Melioribacteraceae bacterium]|nr:MFS transporter [Melioribacteraceae bacterium]MCF8265579.1 MFS transporter [Melioribacteraceae bacterium]
MPKKNLITTFPFYYGYVILVAGTIGAVMSAPGQTVGISVFTDFLISDLGISREKLSLAYLIGTLSSSFILTYAGKFFDNHGARITSVASGFLLGLSLFYMSKVDKIIFFFVSIFGENANENIVFILLILGIWSVRFFGQGVLTMSTKNMVMKWFDKRRGMASAFMGIAISFGFSYSPQVFDWLISLYGWQGAWQIIALVVGVLFAAFALITYRDNPFEFGLKPDGKILTSKKKNESDFKPIKDYTLKQARSTYSFWIFNLTLAFHGLYITALTFHIVDVFKGAGMDRNEAIMIFLPSAVIALVFQIFSGIIADYINMKYLLMIELAGLIIASSGLWFLSPGLPFYLIIIGNGIGSGLFGVVSSVTWPRYFGITHLGAISGFNMSWIVAGSAVGPYLFSLLFKIDQNYQIAGLVCLICCLILFILSFKADNKNLMVSK